MPSIAADYDAIIRALADSYGEPATAEERSAGGFRDLLVVLLAEQRGGKGGRAIDGLDRAGLATDSEALAGVDPSELAEILGDGRGPVRTGLVAVLKRLAAWVVGHGGMEGLEGVGTATLRDELRAIRGIGPGTADRILLEGSRRPTFPIGRSDNRILIRHGWIDPTADYDEAREAIEGAAPADPEALIRLSAWMGLLAKPCRVAAPRCDRCPLRPFLPEGGPLDPS